MVSESVFGFDVERVCHIRREGDGDELTLQLDDAGFLDASASQVNSVDVIKPGALIAPGLAAQAGPLVLLGEPGLGKSTVFEQLVSEHEHAWVDAANLTDATFDEFLGRHLERLPEASDGDRNASVAPVVVVLDQIDESPMVRRLAARLRRALEGRDVSALQLLLACRTADYPPNLTDALRAARLEPVLADLAPLTRNQAARLAESVEGVDGSELVNAVIEAGAGALASVPLTLGMLVRTYESGGELEANPRTLFADGVMQLADEPDYERRGSFESTTDQRRAVAGRIAARLLLSGRRTVWLGAQLDASSHDLRAESLVGGSEQIVGGQVTVTLGLVKEALATALFTGRGAHRLAFRHGSIAAYLAALHIIERQIPQPQLETLFLVSDAVGNRSIPTLLRETAAWLVTLAPEHAEWLVSADPASLVGHSRIVDSNEARALLVDALLRRADEVELADAPWARGRRRISHPGLVDQLRPVFDAAGASEPEDWPSAARVRLAVRLAGEAQVPGLAEPLLRLAESDDWGSRIRQLASLAVYEAEPDQAVPRLTSVLDRLASPDLAAEVDPDDELRGTLLRLLWPDHLALDDALVHLRFCANSNLIGMYRLFRREFPGQVGEEDLATVLRWTRDQARSGGAATGARATEEAVQVEEMVSREVGRGLDERLVDRIIDRALASPTASEHVGAVASLLLARLSGRRQPSLPAPLDLEAGNRMEPVATRGLRRALAKELAILIASRSQGRARADAWTLINGWQTSDDSWHSSSPAVRKGVTKAGRTRLLDANDFEWVCNEAATAHEAGDDALAQAMAQVAVFLFDPTDSRAIDVVYEQRQGPVWNELNHWFEPVDLDGDRAARMREIHAMSKESPEEDQGEPSPEVDEFAATQRRRVLAAVNGDVDAFWRLVWDLQFPPQTLKGVPRLDDDVRDFPGLEVLDGDDAITELSEAALRYLHVEHDHRHDWLGTNRYDKRAWAGYLALALVQRENRLDEVSDDRWRSWVGALVWFSAIPVNAGDQDVKRQLLERAAQHSPTELADAAATYLRGELALGRLGSEIELIDSSWNRHLAATLHALLRELTVALRTAMSGAGVVGNGRDTKANPDDRNDDRSPPDHIELPHTDDRTHELMIWETMLAGLLATHPAAQALAVEALDAGVDDPQLRPLATRAAVLLLQEDAVRWWPRIRAIAAEHPEVGRTILTASAAAREFRPLLADLPDVDLGELYRLLSDLFPPEDDPHHVGVHYVSPEDEARRWRDAILNQLAQRATSGAVAELAELKEHFPDRLIIASHLVRARTLAGESAWTPPHPDELARLFENSRSRLVRSNSELAGVVVEVLDSIAADIGSHGDLLWDRVPTRAGTTGSVVWLPKREASLTAYLVNELKHRLSGRALIVNREVLVHQTNEYGAGDRTDVLIESPGLDGSALEPGYQRVAVVIEVKGPWNDEVRDAQRSQLAERYLPEADTDRGIYLIGWYPIPLWTDTDDNARGKAAAHDPSDLHAFLLDQAGSIREDLSVVTTPIVLTVPRSSPTK